MSGRGYGGSGRQGGRGDGGRGHSGGRGRGRVIKARSITHAAPAGFGSKARLSRESRKASRTALQNAAVEAKHSREADHFFSAARRNAGRRRPQHDGESERELFKATDQGSEESTSISMIL